MTAVLGLNQETIQVIQQNAGSHRLKSLYRRARLAAMQKNREQAHLQRLIRRLGINREHASLDLVEKYDTLQAEYEVLQVAYQQLLAEERQRQDMVNMLIHDLKVPLGSILISLELLTSDFDEGVNDDQRNILRVADQAAQQMLQLIAGLLEVRKLESGRVSLQLQALDLGLLLKRTVQQAQLLADRKGVTLHLDLPDTLPQALADVGLTARIVTNLLDNAIKFTPDGGQIDVACRPSAQELTISVTDGGPGIPADEQEIIFETFTQAGRGDYGAQQASVGLGLAFCKLAVEAQQGCIWVESEPELRAGAQFKFTLPVWQAGSKPPEGQD